MNDMAGRVLALTINAYWFCVLAMALAARLRDRRSAGVIPQKPGERLLWFIWVPTIIAWNVIPWRTVGRHLDAIGGEPLRVAFAFLGLACLLLTAVCWRYMGKCWAMAVVEGSKSTLLRSGPFALIRHPIYSLSIALMACTVAVVQSVPMLGIALIHFVLLVLKARSEEESLLSLHGSVYSEYRSRTGRFLPRIGRMARA